MSEKQKRAKLIDLATEWQYCKGCELHNKCTQKVFGRGNADANVMFVGIGPGEEEDIKGIPFVGRSGLMLQEILTYNHIEWDNVYATNLVLCRPFDVIKKKKENRDPLKQEVEACAERLKHEIYIVDPTLIVLLGKAPLAYLAGCSSSMQSARGKIFEVKLEGKSTHIEYSALPTWHPSYLVRHGSNLKGDPIHQSTLDIQKAYRIANKLDKIYKQLDKEKRS